MSEEASITNIENVRAGVFVEATISQQEEERGQGEMALQPTMRRKEWSEAFPVSGQSRSESRVQNRRWSHLKNIATEGLIQTPRRKLASPNLH